LPGNLPQLSGTDFLKLIGNWDDPSWIETQLRKRGLEDVQVNPVAKTMGMGTAQELVPVLNAPLTLIMSKIWNEEQMHQSGANVIPALEKYLEDTYGKDKLVSKLWVAIVASGRKPL
jgi:hypothetical protein